MKSSDCYGNQRMFYNVTREKRESVKCCEDDKVDNDHVTCWIYNAPGGLKLSVSLDALVQMTSFVQLAHGLEDVLCSAGFDVVLAKKRK
uniref:Uncharacterized protein n=1 Tax=Hyaloperonospora arabidopsidis (strain Emoy2) TaxID=559515 RepID=M4C3W0_HYAAE